MDLADDLHEKGGNERAAVWHARRRPWSVAVCVWQFVPGGWRM